MFKLDRAFWGNNLRNECNLSRNSCVGKSCGCLYHLQGGNAYFLPDGNCRFRAERPEFIGSRFYRAPCFAGQLYSGFCTEAERMKIIQEKLRIYPFAHLCEGVIAGILKGFAGGKFSVLSETGYNGFFAASSADFMDSVADKCVLLCN